MSDLMSIEVNGRKYEKKGDATSYDLVHTDPWSLEPRGNGDSKKEEYARLFLKGSLNATERSRYFELYEELSRLEEEAKEIDAKVPHVLCGDCGSPEFTIQNTCYECMGTCVKCGARMSLYLSLY